MVKRFEINGLFGKIDHTIEFHNDLTVLTGLNGSGKTSILKLLWCLLSTNKGIPLTEMSFQRACVETDKYRLEVIPDYENVKTGPRAAKYTLSLTGGSLDPLSYDILYDSETVLSNGSKKLDILNDNVSELEQPTIYFPTFRRIEGGFETADDYHIRRRRISGMTDLTYAIDSFSSGLSSLHHTFISSIGTNDIARMLLSVNNGINSGTNQLYLRFSRYIERKLSDRSDNNGDKSAVNALNDIERKLEELKAECDKMRRPLDELSYLVRDTFKDGGVVIGEDLILGDNSNAVKANTLSAGEKQMLSFLTYNAFSHDTIVIIDEPELNLHVDWQRILFQKLLEQQTTNQFIIATHSPFIYTRYPENEYFLNANRGYMSWSQGQIM